MLATAEPETGGLTPEEVAECCRVTVQCVYHWIKHGKRINGAVVYLDAERCGGLWRISEADLARFKRQCDPRPWKKAAEDDSAQRKQARREQRNLRERLGGK